MRQHISRAFEHAERLRSLNQRLGNFARQVIGEVPDSPDNGLGGEGALYPPSLPMNEELRIALDAAEPPLSELAEALGWLEQMFGTEVALPSSPVKPGSKY